ncbi:cation diffusion facilitator family transporter [Coprobacter secundus]|uniref:Cation efflux system protein n=1 Tax=Coprobacter secundus subsp. similis TaxID=2751153 RepID=A0A7G1HYY7_9BACT|nr:cation diffusion facilitator family transporter [Coprobacter secundus]BCI64243.1 cation efflux system protein [Coprobacter secundus subsp. similis]
MAHNHKHHVHQHTHNIESINSALVIGIILNTLFVVIEAIAGFYYDSLALLSDAGHNLSDVISLILALLAFRLVQMKPTSKYTYGYKKSSILVSLLNAIILLVAVGMILSESIVKIRHPEPIDGNAIAWVAGVGIIINAFTAFLLFRQKGSDLNIKGAYLHMAADTLVSVGVLISGVVIEYTHWYFVDPIIGIVVAIVILYSTWGLLHDSLRLSLDGVPVDINLDEIKGVLLRNEGVEDVHHLHIWGISTTQNALTAHIVVRSTENMEELKHKLKEELYEHNIQHATLELELDSEHCDHKCC